MSKPRVVVVGAGLGGLATALRLAHRGAEVTVLEKTDQIGGRNRVVLVGECEFDGGPTLLMMLDPFRKLFADVGERLEDHLDLEMCDPSYRVFWRDGSRLDATTDRERMARQISDLAGPKDASAYPRLMGDLKAMYAVAIPNFVERNFRSKLDIFTPRSVALAIRHRMMGNLAAGIARYFDDPRLRALFSFQTMYLGLSPYDAPFVYAVLTYMECGEGIWYPRGGLPEIGGSIARLAESKGVHFRLNAEVCRIEGKAVQLASGERIGADFVVSNADLPYTERALESRRSPDRRYSCSSLVIHVDYEGELPGLLHHNVFFGADFRGNLEDVFHRRTIPTDPAFYAAITARSDPAKAPAGHENLMLLIPCPNLDRPWSEADGHALQSAAFDRLAHEVGFERERIAASRWTTPQDWASELNLDKGAAFGLSHDLWQSACFRPGNRSAANPDLYYVGASTIPGNGLPMVLISADLLEQRLVREGRLSG